MSSIDQDSIDAGKRAVLHSTSTITRDTYQHVRQATYRDATGKVVALLPAKDAAKGTDS